MEYRVISGDAHVDLKWLPGDLFVSNAPARWKDAAPRLVDDEDGGRWFAEGVDLTTRFGGSFANRKLPDQDESKRIGRMYEAGFFDGGLHPTDPELRVRDLEQDGVDAEVVYGILAAGSLITDHDLRNFVYETYNTWAADFRRASPDRLAPLACIPNTDPQVAATELRRSAGLGLRGGELAVSTAVLPIWDRAWDPLWAASDECEVPISFHTTGLQVTKHADQELAREYEAQRSGTFASTFQIAGSEYLAAIIFSGALERYPGMRFVLGECGVGWIPYMLARMDEEYDDLTRLHRLAPRKPSEYWHRQGYTTFQHELNLLPEIVRLVGEDNILWGSDYPHFDGVWPDSRSIIQQDLALLDDGTRQKITCENAGRLYGFIK